jgi:glc operon protein GlcG
MYQSTNLSHEEALRIITRVKSELEKENLGAAIAITDTHGELVAFLRTDGCLLPSINNAINKAFTAARQMQESGEVGRASRTDGFPMTNFGDLRYIAWSGGVPIRHNGQVIGAVGVSGLTEAEDVELARMGAAFYDPS